MKPRYDADAHARKLGFASAEAMDHAQLAADLASDPADSLYAEETGDVAPPSPVQDFAAAARKDAEAVRLVRLQQQEAARILNKERSHTAADRLALGRRLYVAGMSGSDLRRAYFEAGEVVPQRTAERDLKKIRG